jgi:hypothetical protein
MPFDGWREGPISQADRVAKRLVDSDVLAVTSIPPTVANAAVRDIMRLLGRSETDGADNRGHGDKLIAVLKRVVAGRVNPLPIVSGHAGWSMVRPIDAACCFRA